MVSSFGYGLFIWVRSFHLGIYGFHSGMVFSFVYGIVFSFGYGIHIVFFSFGYGVFIQVWSPYLGMVFSFGYGLCIWVWSLHSGNRCRPRIARPTTVEEHSLFCRLELYTISAGS